MSDKITFTHRATKEELSLVPLPLKTRTYVPMPHIEVINMTLDELDRAGLKVLTEDYASARDGRQVRGSYNLSDGDGEMNIKLMFHNSYDKTMPVRWAIGANVIVCSNGVVSGDIGAFKRKHTGTVLNEYREAVRIHIDNAGESFRKIQRERDRMKEITMTKQTTSELMGRLFLEESLVTITQLAIIKKEIENPSFKYGVEGTLWNDYNAVTVALRDAHPSQYMKQHAELHKFIEKEYAL